MRLYASATSEYVSQVGRAMPKRTIMRMSFGVINIAFRDGFLAEEELLSVIPSTFLLQHLKNLLKWNRNEIYLYLIVYVAQVYLRKFRVRDFFLGARFDDAEWLERASSWQGISGAGIISSSDLGPSFARSSNGNTSTTRLSAAIVITACSKSAFESLSLSAITSSCR